MAPKLFFLSCLALLIAACATATPFAISGGAQQNATIEGDSGFFEGMPTPGGYAFLEAINGKNISSSASSAMVPPGTYKVSVECEIHAGSQFIQGSQTITFTVEAGHIYKFAVDPAEQKVSGHSVMTKIFGDEVEVCKPFVYDATGGAGPYPETAHVTNPPGAGSDWNGSGKAYGGHFIQDWVPKLQSEDHWNEMLEIEYWSKLMFPETADQLFHARIDSAEKQCPGIHLTVLSETSDDVYFILENSSCAASPVREQLARFMTGHYGVYEVSYLSINPITDADKTAWLQALHNANTITQH
ncbi:MAG TPA: hypothetical protein VJS89_03315 [Gammaproteobacteria bacterium]|nr:hypothetical protein [Gammaproteobacteria bacterium]